MAKFYNYCVLCPLIDQKSFLGVSRDNDPQAAIITLSRNIINRYRLSDQKQIGGWTSRDHLTSEVIYDFKQKNYVGVFNNNTIKVWDETTDNLDKVKKHKFPINILKVISTLGKYPIILFADGSCASLVYALENRKTFKGDSLFKHNETIAETSSYCLKGQYYICSIIKDNNDNYELVFCRISKRGKLDKNVISRIKISRPDDVYVVGHYIRSDKGIAVFILWSDAKMMMYNPIFRTWSTIGTVPWISTFGSVSITMFQSNLLLFGSNMDQDGAIVVGYNVVLGIGFCKYPLKMYSEGASLHCFRNRVVLEATNHIGVLHFNLKSRRSVSALLGCHEVPNYECPEIASWETSTVPLFIAADELKEHIKKGFTERAICCQVITPLLEQSDTRQVLKIIKEFKDVPESVLVQLLNYALKTINISNVDVTNHEEFMEFFSSHATDEKFALLNYIFQITLSDAFLIQYLRNGITLNDTIFLMTYSTYLLLHSEMNIDSDYESKVLDWCILLMDAFYQQYLMTKDKKVTYVLERTLNTVKNLLQQLDKINGTMMTLNQFLSGKEIVKESLPYSIEVMKI